MDPIAAQAANAPSLTELAQGRGLAQMLERSRGGPEKLQDAARDFESVLLVRLLEEMRRGIPEGGLLDDPLSKQMNDMFWYYLAQDLAGKGGIGLAEQIYSQLSARFETGQSPSVEQLL